MDARLAPPDLDHQNVYEWSRQAMSFLHPANYRTFLQLNEDPGQTLVSLEKVAAEARRLLSRIDPVYYSMAEEKWVQNQQERQVGSRAREMYRAMYQALLGVRDVPAYAEACLDQMHRVALDCMGTYCIAHDAPPALKEDPRFNSPLGEVLQKDARSTSK